MYNKFFILVCCLFFWVCTPLTAFAVPHPSETLSNPALEARAKALGYQLRCVVCQNETIEESRADMARDMRLLIRKHILDGQTDAQIIGALKDSYGDRILMTPPLRADTALLWGMPLLVLVVGTLLITPHMRKKRRRHA